MRVERMWRRAPQWAALVMIVLINACVSNDSLEVGEPVPVPSGVTAEAVSVRGVQISWKTAGGPQNTFELQRRKDLTGEFATLARNLPGNADRVVFFDTDVTADTYYGYRIISQSSVGVRSAASNIVGVKTPPPPTIIVRVATRALSALTSDPDGYTVAAMSTRDTLIAQVGTNGVWRFRDIRPGTYTVLLRGLSSNCDFRSGDSTRVAQVSDAGVVTEAAVEYDLSCRDPNRGSVVVRYEQTGDTTDADGVRVAFTGRLEPDAVDPSLVYAAIERINVRIGTFRYDNLRRGEYEIALEDVGAPCQVVGPARRSVTIRQLSVDSLRFDVSCLKTVQPDSMGKAIVLKHAWSSQSAPNGAKVSLNITLDGTRRPGVQFVGAQASVLYDATVLRADSARGLDFRTLAANRNTPGLVNYAALDPDGTGKNGNITVGRLWFTVIGQTGKSTTTRTTVGDIPSVPGNISYRDSTRAEESTFTVGSFSTQNRSPSARANGPYSATVDIPLQFTASGSVDPDGTIASYAWTFGDGGTGTGETVQHTYRSAGTFTVRVTVTDDAGATGVDSAVVTVVPNAVPNVAPIARIDAPATGTPNTTVAFSGTQSTDVDGVVAVYAWNFGDGTTGANATEAKVYAASGTYTVTLTVTDNRGATATASHTITIALANNGAPFTWTGSFGTYNPATKDVLLTITLDLTTDIPDTPGIEALRSYVVDSLRWDPAALQLVSFNFGTGEQQNINQSDAGKGKLSFNGSTLPGADTGVITLARIRFRAVGASGKGTTTTTGVGALLSTTANGSFNYRAKTEVREASFVIP